MISRSKVIPYCLLVICLAAFSFYVWPTPFRYDHLKLDKDTYPVRINRFTGSTEVFSPSGWAIIASEDAASTPNLIELSKEDISKLEGTAKITSYGYIECDIYNGTTYTLDEIIIQYTIRQDDQVILSRLYDTFLDQHNSGDPLAVSKFKAKLGQVPIKGQDWTWKVSSAKGKNR